MVPAKRLKDYLDSRNVKYVTISHSLAFTAIEIAKSAHIPTKEMAKTLIIQVDGKVCMLVLPASDHIDLQSLHQVFSADCVELASEQELSGFFPDCEIGAMPPFGNLYDMDVYLAESITERDQIVFNAGSHLEVIKMSYSDYESLVSPKFILLSS